MRRSRIVSSLCFFMLVFFAFGETTVPFAQTISGVIISENGPDRYIIDVGLQQGVRVGMKGRIFYADEASGANIYVATFEVEKLTLKYSSIKVVREIAAVKPDFRLEWYDELIVPQVRTGADWFQEGYKAFNEGDFEDAKANFEQAIETDPGLEEAVRPMIEKCENRLSESKINRELQNLLAAQERARQEEQAQLDIERSEEKPRIPVYRTTARTFAAERNYARARDFWKKILFVFPDDAEALEGLATVRKNLPMPVQQLLKDMVRVPRGYFIMGSSPAEPGRNSNESQHPVVISSGFYIGKYEITQMQWQAVMGTTLSQQRDKEDPKKILGGEGANHPMYYVNWDEACEFCVKLSGLTGMTFRLPTEAEWEYACRAGTDTTFYWGNSAVDAEIQLYAWYRNNTNQRTLPVGLKRPNGLGLYDMTGNVAEWCMDYWGGYPEGPVADPVCTELSDFRIIRGGALNNPVELIRTAFRGCYMPENRLRNLGFRVVRVIDSRMEK